MAIPIYSSNKYICMDISTLEDIYYCGTALRTFFTRVYQELLFPLGESLCLDSKLFDRKYSRCIMNHKNWSIIGRKLIAGEIEELVLKSFRVESDDYSNLVTVSIRNWPSAQYRVGVVNLKVRTDLIAKNLDPFQEKLVEIAAETFTALRAISGYITMHSKQDVINYKVLPWNFRKSLTGIFWANFLSVNHIIKLGGVERIKIEAPVYRVKEIGSGDRQGILLQLSPVISAFSSRGLVNFREYLKPILPIKKDRVFIDLPIGS